MSEKTEASLREYYDQHVCYDSPMTNGKASDICKAIGLRSEAGGVRFPVLVDLGCGTGEWVNFLDVTAGCEVFGFDYSIERLADAKSRFPFSRFELKTIEEAVAWAFGVDFKVNIWTLWDVLEHLEDPVKILDSLQEFEPGGVIYASVPINMPDPAHLHVWKTAGQLVDHLQPTQYTEWTHDGRDYALLRWNIFG